MIKNYKTYIATVTIDIDDDEIKHIESQNKQALAHQVITIENIQAQNEKEVLQRVKSIIYDDSGLTIYDDEIQIVVSS